MSSTYEKQLLEPPLSAWPGIRCVLHNERLQTLREAARQRLVDAATGYRAMLVEIGRAAGLFAAGDPAISGDPGSQPLIMTGHQPVIFHSGLTFKYQATETFALEHNALVVAVVIDTDEGDAGAFSFPSSETSAQLMADKATDRSMKTTSNQMSTVTGSFSVAASLLGASRRKSSDLIRTEASPVVTALHNCGCHAEADRFQQIAEQYASLPTDSMMEANLIVRWNAGIAGKTPEIPLSMICSFPEVLQFFAELLARPFEFARCYNDTLDAFRTEQKIRNVANPFPNLLIGESRCELPFWLIDPAKGTREIVSIRKQGFERLLEAGGTDVTEILPGNEGASLFSLLVGGKQLIPRGGLITATLRILFSDLFVHGTGGGRYDVYTSQFIRAWWKVEPTPFAVASASRYLFDQERRQLSRLQEISDNIRDYQFNPQRYFSSGVFSSDTETALRAALAEKELAVNEMRSARASGLPADEIGRRIQRLGDLIKSTVTAEFSAQLTQLQAISEETKMAVNSRTWPWFFFA
ncbi:MAG: hypothetical protein U0936_19810 [Planctomycetaceae bacterium]